MPRKISVLVADDEDYVRGSLCESLAAAGLEPRAADGVESAVRELSSAGADVLVTDLSMPGGGGRALLERARQIAPQMPVVLISGVGTVKDAVAAIKAGAYDFLVKPVEPDELLLVTTRAAAHRGLVDEVARLRSAVQSLRPPRTIVGGSPAMERLRALVAQVGPTDVPVLIRGESGSGKELLAEAIHGASPRSGRGFVRLFCASVSQEALEREWVGTAERPGKLEQAEGGTLVLDEVDAASPVLQERLLALLERGEMLTAGTARARSADVRVVALTKEDLAQAARRGSFREDLFFRLNVFPIEIPPLREHKADIEPIARALLAEIASARGGGRAAPALALESLEALASYDWPGNVRELRNVLERAWILSAPGEITPELLRGALESALALGERPARGATSDFHLRRNLDELEKQLIVKAIAACDGKKKEACAQLGIDPRNLGYYLRKHGL
jgi:DNA-binding NtrC family response regulator